EYTGIRPVISSPLADTPCATLGIQGLLDRLNTTLGTSHTLTRSLSSLLKDCISKNYDFGVAYGRLRQLWYTRDWSNIRDTFRELEEEDWEMRQKALVGNQIVEPHLPPRRTTGLGQYHMRGWDEEDRVDVWTPINGYGWPVPIPKDTNLNLIRIEMLNRRVEYYHEAEYVWLDVLCLRQVSVGPGEDMRMEEWKLDVPTIGAMYQSFNVVCYLSGLGRPLSLKEGDLESDRCWFRRAWTLQEVGRSRVIVGDTPDGPLHVKPIDNNGNYGAKLLTEFHKQLQSINPILHGSMLVALESMQNRVSTNPVDKVAGLAFVMGSKMIPAYYESQSLEEAWMALVNSVDARFRAELFGFYPEPGNASTKWRPSWEQLM
ncbi:uncharacterized protein EV420DRAFT_1215455, partial [Desarmillaria tabescens]